MTDNTDTPKHRLTKVHAAGETYVEAFRIQRTAASPDETVVRVLMRLAGADPVYYLNATVTYAEDERAGHHVIISRRGCLVDEFSTDIVTAEPDDRFEIVQAMHDTYVQAADDWYSFALAADHAGDG